MTTGFGGWRPDGPVMYWTDPATGDRIGVLPRTCKRGLHDLYRSGYTPQMRGESLLQ